MNSLQAPVAAGKSVSTHVMEAIKASAAGRYPNWADNEHPDARAYNAYQLGALEHYWGSVAEKGPRLVAPLAHQEAARDLCYALWDLGPLNKGENHFAARNLILEVFAKIAQLGIRR